VLIWRLTHCLDVSAAPAVRHRVAKAFDSVAQRGGVSAVASCALLIVDQFDPATGALPRLNSIVKMAASYRRGQ
jgi:hypothetical protein